MDQLPGQISVEEWAAQPSERKLPRLEPQPRLTERVELRLTPELKALLKADAAQCGTSVNAYIFNALCELYEDTRLGPGNV